GGPLAEHRAGRRRRRTRRRGSRSGKLCLNLLELPLQQLGLAFEALDLRRLRRRLRASSGRNEQRRAQKCGARRQLLLEIHDRPPSKTRAGDPVPPPSATIPPVNNRLMTNPVLAGIAEGSVAQQHHFRGHTMRELLPRLCNYSFE